jgi:DNA-binding PadR family transcriptional regulator
LRRAESESFEDCPCSGRSLARLVHAAVLGALAKGEGHGYEVAQRLAALPAFASQPADFAAIYRALGALERDGYAQSRWEEPRSGPARKVFRLTSAGRACLGQWRRTLRSYRRELDDLLGFL